MGERARNRTVGIVDYGMGNLHSLRKALEQVAGSWRVVVSYEADKLEHCSKLVLPGVGGIAACMKELRRLELDELLRERVRVGTPLLGICLGMQALLDRSEENDGVVALGLIPGTVKRFPDPVAGEGERLKVPHMGWNRIRIEREHPILRDLPDQAWFYFVHSYYAVPERDKHVLATTDYICRFASVIGRGCVVGCQFHPEKSQRAGLQMLANFLDWDPDASG